MTFPMLGCPADFLFANVAQALAKHGVYVVVCKGVVHVLARALRFHKMRLLQYAKLMRYRALGGIHGFCNVRNAKLAAHQRKQYLDARGVCEHLEQVGKVVKGFLCWGLLEGADIFANAAA